MHDVFVYVAGRLSRIDKTQFLWKLLGVYTERPLAERACEERDDFVRAVPLNAPLPVLTRQTADMYFPARTRKS